MVGKWKANLPFAQAPIHYYLVSISYLNREFGILRDAVKIV
jgi:hypothetical protein